MSRNALTAIAAALQAAGGGFQGYGKDQERRRLESEREQERAYRQETDTAALMRQGFVSPESLASTRERTGGAVAGHVMDSVQSMMFPGAPPPDAARLDRVLKEAGGAFRPEQSVTIGGRRLVLPETDPQRQERMLATQTGERRGERQQADAVRKLEREQDAAQRKAELEANADLQRQLTAMRNQPMPERPVDEALAVRRAVSEFAAKPIPGPLNMPASLPTDAQVQAFEQQQRRIWGLDPSAPVPTGDSGMGGGRAGGGTESDTEARGRAWAAANPRYGGESIKAYAKRIQQGVQGGG